MPHVSHCKVGIGCKGVAEGDSAAARVGEAGRSKDVVGGQAASHRATERDGAGEITDRAVVVVLGSKRDRERGTSRLRRGNGAPGEMIQQAPGRGHVEWVAQTSVAVAVVGAQYDVARRG